MPEQLGQPASWALLNHANSFAVLRPADQVDRAERVVGWIPVTPACAGAGVHRDDIGGVGIALIHTVSPRGLSPRYSAKHTPLQEMPYSSQSYWTYILASKPRGTLYIGMTDGIIFRVEQHRAGEGSAFTRKYKVHALVWYQEYADVTDAIQREKTMKEWPRAWKVNLIERTNPHWDDLYPSLPGVRPVSL